MTQELEDDRNSNPLLGRSVGPYQGSDQDMAKATTKDAGAGNMASYSDLKAQRDALNAKLAELREEELAAFKEDVARRAAELEVNILDLFSPPKPEKKGKGVSSGPPKYLNPVTGDTFSGRGRTASWLQELIDQGKDKDDFLNPDWVRANE